MNYNVVIVILIFPNLIRRIITAHIWLPGPLTERARIHPLLLRATNTPSRRTRRVTQIIRRHIRSEMTKRFRAGGTSGALHNVLGFFCACRRHLHFLPPARGPVAITRKIHRNMRYSFSWIQLKVNLKARSCATPIERLLGQFVTVSQSPPTQ